MRGGRSGDACVDFGHLALRDDVCNPPLPAGNDMASAILRKVHMWSICAFSAKMGQHYDYPNPIRGSDRPQEPVGAGAAHVFPHRADMEAHKSEEHTSELPSLMRISYAV